MKHSKIMSEITLLLIPITLCSSAHAHKRGQVRNSLSINFYL